MLGISRSRKSANIAVAAIAGVGFFAVGATAAHASGDTIVGGCFASTAVNSIATNGQNVGAIAIAAITRDDSGPESARVDCWIDVNGVELPGTKLSSTGVGVQLAQQQISYSSFGVDRVELCEQVYFWNDGFDTGPICQPSVIRVVVPTPNPVVGPLNRIFPDTIDPRLCPELAALAGTYTDLQITPSGDVWFNDPFGLVGLVYDCPPY
jgi:hypothetical protein